MLNLNLRHHSLQSQFYSSTQNVHFSWASHSLFYSCLIKFRLYIFFCCCLCVPDFTLIYLLLKCPLHCPLLYQEGVIVTNTLFSRRKGESLVAPPFFGISPTFQFRYDQNLVITDTIFYDSRSRFIFQSFLLFFLVPNLLSHLSVVSKSLKKIQYLLLVLCFLVIVSLLRCLVVYAAPLLYTVDGKHPKYVP